MNMELQTRETEAKVMDLGFVNRLTELPITNREKEILVHLAKGKTNKQISQDLMLSTSTVRNHISSIFTKLKISNRSQATAIAIYAGLLNIDQLA
jgi:DNA-binding NarL/FixJ family response regulator